MAKDEPVGRVTELAEEELSSVRRDTLEEIFLKAMGHLTHTPGEGAAGDVEPNVTAN